MIKQFQRKGWWVCFTMLGVGIPWLAADGTVSSFVSSVAGRWLVVPVARQPKVRLKLEVVGGVSGGRRGRVVAVLLLSQPGHSRGHTTPHSTPCYTQWSLSPQPPFIFIPSIFCRLSFFNFFVVAVSLFHLRLKCSDLFNLLKHYFSLSQ